MCKILRVSSGAELAHKGAELAYHFDNQGTPVMIGASLMIGLGANFLRLSPCRWRRVSLHSPWR